jgi:hypothetical protein
VDLQLLHDAIDWGSEDLCLGSDFGFDDLLFNGGELLCRLGERLGVLFAEPNRMGSEQIYSDPIRFQTSGDGSNVFWLVEGKFSRTVYGT